MTSRLRKACTAAVCLAAFSSGFIHAADKCVIRGRVLSAATGTPLKKAAVWVEAFSPTRGVNGAPAVSGPATVTDAEGRFTLDNIDPGSYLLSARRTGYLDQGFGAEEPEVVGPPVKLAPGDTLGDVTLKLTPQSLLYGKVVDEDGDPVPDAEVMVYKMSYAGGRKQFANVTGTVSQADGSMVAGNLRPGRYYLCAFIRKGEQDPDAREIYVPTYYPSTANAADAAPIDVNAGAEVRGLAIRLRKSGVFHIRGKIAAAGPNAPLPRVSLTLVPRTPSLVEPEKASASTTGDGRFEFHGVLPGSYRIETDRSGVVLMDGTIMVDASPARDTALFGRAIVGVSDSDVEDVTVLLSKGADISGAISGAAGNPKPAGVALLAGSNLYAKADGAGAFRFHNVPPDDYELGIRGLPEGTYVKSVTFAGQDVTNQDLDLTSGAGGRLEITLASDGGEVAGVARNAKGDPVPGALVQIWPADGDTARSVKADETGAFRFHSLPPAAYRVAAWEDLDDDLAAYPAFRARFQAQAAPVEITPKAHERVEVTAISRAAAAAEAVKLN